MNAEPAGSHLPVAGPAKARGAALRLIRHNKLAFAAMIALYALAAVAGLVGPWLLGIIVDIVQVGGNVGRVDLLALLILVVAGAQLVCTRFARYAGTRFGERMSAHVRETFLDRVLALRASTVERTDTGDLTARATGDVTTVAGALRDAAPDLLIAAAQALFVLVAVFLASPLLGVCSLAGLLGIWFAGRWYLRRARGAYLAAGAANSMLSEVLVATASGARTVEALGLQENRLRAGLDAIERCWDTRMRALSLRTVLFPILDVSYFLPIVAVLMVGGVLYGQGAVSLGAVVSCLLYLRLLSGPLETLSLWIDQLQSSAASFARLEGLSGLDGPQPASTKIPVDDRIKVQDVHYAYDGGHDVLHGVDLEVRPGERLAIVGPSGAGKSTLGRLLAGIDVPRHGSVTVGGVAVSALSPEQLRRQIVLVTQEHHVFHDSIRNNLLIAKPSASDVELRAAFAAVGAEWLDELADGLDTLLDGRAYRLDGAQAQQLALARVVLTDPHTLVLDEATALLDPTTARSTERALSAVLRGRTVLAIAHRLHTAHDADRVAVIRNGSLTEIGTHNELVASRGAYAGLWHSWHGEGPRSAP